MRTERTILRTALLTNALRKSLHLAAAAACVGPAIAQAQTWNPTASDARYNTAAGAEVLQNHLAVDSGSYNTGIGYRALFYNTGYANTANGYGALHHNTLGGSNTASGYRTLYSNTTGGGNTASGVNVLTSNTTGIYNTASGASALTSNTTGNDNTASGAGALFSNTTGDSNTASGGGALHHNTIGKYNTASGDSALYFNTTGNNNTALGYQALSLLTSGGSNIALGANAGKNLKTGSSNIYIGHIGIAGGVESKVLRIGQVQTKTFIAGIKGVPVSGAAVVVRANGQLGVVASSARYKTDIRDLANASDRLTQLRPVSYRYKSEPGVTHYGLIAEEVDRVMPELVVRDEENRPETVQYHEIIPLLLQQRNEQQARLDRQQTRLDLQDQVIDRLKAEIAELRRARFAATAAAK